MYPQPIVTEDHIPDNCWVCRNCRAPEAEYEKANTAATDESKGN